MTTRTRIKLCGFTRSEDIQAAVAAGADAIGLIFFSKSRRVVTRARAKALRDTVPAFVNVAALFVNAEPEFVEDVIHTVSPDVLQFHGNESPAECEQYGKRYIRAFRVGAPGMETREEVLAECSRFGSASAWLFDSYSAGYGGSGEGFDLSLLGAVRNAAHARPMVLAGGLSAENVGDYIRKLRPFAVDVSSGIEDAPGIKSADKIAAFADAVRAVDCQPA